MALNIFESGESQGGKWFYHKEVGDAIQGTYIDVREGVDGYGNAQKIYVLKDADGVIWNMGVRVSNEVLNDRMKGIRLGQIIGFRLDELRESKKSPTGKAKIIRVYEDPKVVDLQWLDERKRLETIYNSNSHAAAAPTTESLVSNDPREKAPMSAPFPMDLGAKVAPAKEDAVSETHQTIRNIAITKGLITDTMSPSEQDAKIIEYTGLAFTDENMASIIVKVTTFKK